MIDQLLRLLHAERSTPARHLFTACTPHCVPKHDVTSDPTQIVNCGDGHDITYSLLYEIGVACLEFSKGALGQNTPIDSIKLI